VQESILHKQGELTAEEWVTIHMHPFYAHEIIGSIDLLKSTLDIAYCHHEKWDGSGYPRGLKGEQIPLAARLFAIVDVYDALTSDRPFRKAWSKAKALEYIREQSGQHFDPQVVAAFLQMQR
jgi:HD-GYP domain-containing protein (c-di-GMP phosphodiesterase class II)